MHLLIEWLVTDKRRRSVTVGKTDLHIDNTETAAWARARMISLLVIAYENGFNKHGEFYWVEFETPTHWRAYLTARDVE